MSLAPLGRFSPKAARLVRAVFTDIDDTLSSDGRVEAPAFEAMWRLHRAGIAVVPVTGRPAGWCDHIARMWPVVGVVGENGAFYFRYDAARKTLVRRFIQSEVVRRRNRARLERLREEILAAVPGSAVASDQAFRVSDLAIDYCEDVPRLSSKKVQAIVEIFQAHGAVAKVSSIHVNGWFGRFDKLGMIRKFSTDVLGFSLDEAAGNRRAVYVGDSPNDEPAFAFFRHAVGVANVRAFETMLEHPPAYVTSRPGGAGFAQLARHLLRARTGAAGTR